MNKFASKYTLFFVLVALLIIPNASAVILSVTKTGTGSGAIASTPAGINCGPTCSYNFLLGINVTLTATAATNSTFKNWIGCDYPINNTCKMTMTGDRTVTANFSIRCVDVDGDGYGVYPNNGTIRGCRFNGHDCNDQPTQCGVNCNPGYPSDTYCDHYDNDCDKRYDEDFGWQDPINGWRITGTWCDGYGECDIGVVECKNLTAATCSTNPDGSEYIYVPELCDHLDNDCDRRYDEDFGWMDPINGWRIVGTWCEGIGECEMGVVECKNSTSYNPESAVCSSNPDGSESEAKPEICDNKDNDCNNVTDNGVCTVYSSDDTEDSASCAGNCHSSWARGADENWGDVAADNGNCTNEDRPRMCVPNAIGTNIQEEYNWTATFQKEVKIETKYQIKSPTGSFNVSCYNNTGWMNIYSDFGIRYPWIIQQNISVPVGCIIPGQKLKLQTNIFGAHLMAPTFYYESRIWYYSPQHLNRQILFPL